MMRFPVSRPTIGAPELAEVAACLTDGWITQGGRVAAFEAQLAHHLDVDRRRVVACSTGTAALHMALVALGIGPGDEVLVPDLTYIATLNAVLYAGATPVLVDVDPRTWNIDLTQARVGPRTKAVMPVHLYGVPVPLEAIHAFSAYHHLGVVEDAAEALGAHFEGGQACGTFGLGCFSFYGNKVVTTAEGGAVVASSPELAILLRSLRGQGQSLDRRFHHERMGFNYRMSDVHAAIGVAQLRRLDYALATRTDVTRAYTRELRGVLTIQECAREAIPAPWLFTGLLPVGTDRTRVRALLAAQGIETRPAFVPLHRQPYVGGEDTAFPMAAMIGDRGISLPTYPGLTQADVKCIADALKEAL